MVILALFSWWYTTGWVQLGGRAVQRVAGVLDFFSIGLLLGSLFAPFRQISVGRVQGSLSVQMRAWADKQLSRAIGAIVRSGVIIFGLGATIVMILVSLGLLVLWPLVPIMPFIFMVILGVI